MIYWFKTKNPRTGLTNQDSVFDANEKSAYLYLQSPKMYEYVGASDGSHISKAHQTMKYKDKLPQRTTGVQREKILTARQKEIDSADPKIKPRNFDRTDVGGNPIKSFMNLTPGVIR